MVRNARLKDGSVVEIRAVEPGDAELLVRGFEELSQRSRYERFFTAVPYLPSHWVDELVDLDHRDREAIGALDPVSGAGVGVARYVRLEENPTEAEFAVTVADDWHGRGLGRMLLDELFDAARANGITTMSGDILATNTPMLRLAGHLGRTATIGPAESGVVHAVIEL